MAKVAFVQYELRTRVGIMMLSAMLKRHGHQTRVFTSYDRDMIKSIADYNPSFIALSSSTIEHLFTIDMAGRLRQAGCKAFIIIGGPHPTFYPEETLKERDLDAVCIGEGDDLVVEIASRLSQGENYDDLKNLWIKKDGGIIRNEPRNLIEDLDKLPFPDREIYFEKYSVLKNSPTATFILGRGCPFNCSYCFNHLLRRIYEGKGRFVRFPSIDYAIAQIKEVKKRYGFKWVQLNDDTINANRRWFKDFLLRYKEEIDVPFVCNIRTDAMDEELTELMIYAGVNRVNFGVESGNERIRRDILNRKIKDEQLIKTGRMFTSQGVRVYTANMIGLPGETLENAFETIDINVKIKPELAAFDILQPFPKTDIYRYCAENNLLKESGLDDYSGFNCGGWNVNTKTGSLLNQANINELVNLHKFASLLVRYYWLKPLVKILIKLKPNRIFDFIDSFQHARHKIKYASGVKEKFIYIKDLFRILLRR